MRKRPKQGRSEATVSIILEAAAQVLIEGGYAHATTNRIAARAGVSVGSVYQYFDGKDDIFDRVLDRYLKTLLITASEASLPVNGTLQATFEAITRAGLEAWPSGPRLLRALSQSPAPSFRDRIDRVKQQMAGYIRSLDKLDKIASGDADLELKLRLAMDAAEGLFLNVPPNLALDRFAHELACMTARYLLPLPGEQRVVRGVRLLQ